MRPIVLVLTAAAPLLAASDARQWADYWADAYGLHRELVYAVIEVESAWNERAVSPAGAAGLMQLMPGTAVAFGVRNRFGAAENIRGGVAYLAWLVYRFDGDVRLAIAGYYAGHHRISRQTLHEAAPEVHTYVSRVAERYRRHRMETLLRLEKEDVK